MPGVKRSFSMVATPKAATGKKVKFDLVSKPRKKKSYGQKGVEMKFLDIASTFNASLTASVTSMSSLAQGLTNLTRIGNKIQIKSAAVRISAVPIANGTLVASNVHKWMIVLDKEPDVAAIAAYGDIMATPAQVQSFSLISNSDRFVVLATGTWAHGGRSVTAGVVYSDGGEMSKYVDEWRKCDIAAKYVGTGATQASIGSNQLLFTIISENDDTNLIFNVITRIRFQDE